MEMGSGGSMVGDVVALMWLRLMWFKVDAKIGQLY